MLISNAQGLLESSLLNALGVERHGFSTRKQGDARDAQVKRDILHRAGVSEFRVNTQVHGTTVRFIDDAGPDESMPPADATVSGVTGIAVGILTADCVPILLADTKTRIVAAVHAGWRGTKSGIVPSVIHAMLSRGATSDTLYAAIGPRIGACCYIVDEGRAAMFLRDYHDDPTVAGKSEHGWYIDLAAANYRSLVGAGVPPSHIDAPPSCTSCQHDTFFSYRKDTGDTFGEMISFIEPIL